VAAAVVGAESSVRAAKAGEPADLAGARARLAAGQSALLAALVAGGADPAGFDRDALAATRQALIDKRRSGVARRWPALAMEPGFAAAFAAWAAARPPAGSFDDGLAFGRARPADLSPAARAELLYGRCAARRLAVVLDRAEDGDTLLALRTPVLGTLILRTPGRRRGSTT